MKKKILKKKNLNFEKTTLNEIIQIEKELLIIYENYRFNLSFDLLIKLNKALNLIGEVTNVYFQSIDEFSSIKALKYQYFKDKAYNDEIENYNNKLLSDKITFNIKKYQKLLIELKKYINIL